MNLNLLQLPIVSETYVIWLFSKLQYSKFTNVLITSGRSVKQLLFSIRCINFLQCPISSGIFLISFPDKSRCVRLTSKLICGEMVHIFSYAQKNVSEEESTNPN